jgi:hypothetical protein
MAEKSASSPNRNLEIRIQEAVDRWIRPCFAEPCEHIVACVNDLDEVRLSGLVHDPRLVEEAIRMIKELHGVGHVSNDVIIMHTGHPIAL